VNARLLGWKPLLPRIVFTAWMICIHLLLCSPCAFAEDVADVREQLRALDKNIVFELIELARFNAQYQQAVNHHARWRNLVYPLAQEATYAGFMGYSVVDLHEHSTNWNKPSGISKTALRHGLESANVGAILGGGSSGLELLCCAAESHAVHAKGFGSSAAIATVASRVRTVDALIARRGSLLDQLPSTLPDYELWHLKGYLFQYERDRLTYEFQRWNAHSRGFFWYRNAFYVQNILANSIRFAGIQVAFQGLKSRPYLGAVSPMFLVSSVVASATPAISSMVGHVVERRQTKVLSRDLPAKPFLTDAQAKQQLERLSHLLDTEIPQRDNQLRMELTVLRTERVGMDKLINQSEQDIEKLHRVAAQQTIAAPLVGTLTAASATTNTVSYHAYRNRPSVSNHLGFAADFGTLTAEVIALYSTPKAAISAYLYERKLKSRGVHPEQLLSKRLEELQLLENTVKDPNW
jgi:hypothetical protein